jgi:hypothetical protein
LERDISTVEHHQLPVIGRDISWDELNRQNPEGFLRVTHFTPFASVEGDKVKAMSPVMPYGSLIVESLTPQSLFTLLVAHKVDFLHLCFAYNWCKDSEAQKTELRNRSERFKFLSGRDDFAKLYSRVWKTQKMEILVAPAPFLEPQQGLRKWVRRLSGAVLPGLIVWVCPEGQLERIVSNDWGGLDGVEWYAVSEPLVELKPEI